MRVHLFLPSTLTGTHHCSDFRRVTKSVPCLTHPNSSPTGYGRASPTSLSLLSQQKRESEIQRLLLTEGLGTPRKETEEGQLASFLCGIKHKPSPSTKKAQKSCVVFFSKCTRVLK